MKFAIPAYATNNLGDTIQSIALSCLTGKALGIMRHRMAKMNWGFFNRTFVVNGWHCNGNEIPPKAAGAKTLFLGIHTYSINAALWAKESPWPVGARDPATAAFLRSHGVNAEVVGCPTILLQRPEPHTVEWARTAVVSVDMPKGQEVGEPCESQWMRKVPGNFKTAWKLAKFKLACIANYGEVHTTRLHIALPCLAFGTPVRLIPPRGPAHDARFSLWHHWGLPIDKLITRTPAEIAAMAAPLLKLFETATGTKAVIGNPVFPDLPHERKNEK